MKTALRLVEKGLVPTSLVRRGIRRLLKDRLREQRAIFDNDRDAALERWLGAMREAPVAPVPDKANEQHYEVPPQLFQLALGKRLKYSSGFYPHADATLDDAEEAMLALTCQRARLEDGQRVLEMGCGWGSLTLWMAEQYPGSRITAVSNSAPQREFILARAAERGFDNVEVVTCDMNEFEPDTGTARYDRIVSVEMFEHMRNWEALLTRASSWLERDGLMFMHVFAHRTYAYPFEVRGDSDWMSEHFFTGGMMPSHDLVRRVNAPLNVEQSWEVPGTHYARTSEHWLENLERNKAAVLALFRETYGTDQAERWYQRWRVFFLSCAELFGFANGTEWIVSHHLLSPRTRDARIEAEARA